MREKVALISKIRAIESVPKIRFKVTYFDNQVLVLYFLLCIRFRIIAIISDISYTSTQFPEPVIKMQSNWDVSWVCSYLLIFSFEYVQPIKLGF